MSIALPERLGFRREALHDLPLPLRFFSPKRDQRSGTRSAAQC
jgi:hypothetical protein